MSDECSNEAPDVKRDKDNAELVTAIGKLLGEMEQNYGRRLSELERRLRALEAVRDREFEIEATRRLQLTDLNAPQKDNCCGESAGMQYRLERMLRKR